MGLMPWDLDRLELTELQRMVEARHGRTAMNPGKGHRDAAIAALEKAFADEDPT